MDPGDSVKKRKPSIERSGGMRAAALSELVDASLSGPLAGQASSGLCFQKGPRVAPHQATTHFSFG